MRLPFMSVRVHDGLVAAKDAEIAVLREQLADARERHHLAEERLLMLLTGLPLYVRKEVDRPSVKQNQADPARMTEQSIENQLWERARRETRSNKVSVISRQVQAYRDAGEYAPPPVRDTSNYTAVADLDAVIADGRARAHNQ